MTIGADIAAVGAASTGVLVADDLTVVGVADDVLIPVTASVALAGGTIFVVGGLISWLSS